MLNGRAFDALDRVGLAARGGDTAGHMSHGEHRQLEIAMALATDPSALLLDEPMAGMGPEESARIGAMPMIEWTVVVLPMPLRPMRVANSPAAMARSTPNRAWLAP